MRELFFFFSNFIEMSPPHPPSAPEVTAPDFLYKRGLGMAVWLGWLIAMLLWHFLLA